MKPLMVVLYFFFAHRAVSFMYSYLPHALPNPVIGLVGSPSSWSRSSSSSASTSTPGICATCFLPG